MQVQVRILHFEDLRRRSVPIRGSENVLNPQGQNAVKSLMPDCDTRYVVTAPEDEGVGSVRRDRGFQFGLAKPYKWIADPQELHHMIAEVLSQQQVPQEFLWWVTDPQLLRYERKLMSSRFRTFTPDGSLWLTPYDSAIRSKHLTRIFLGVQGHL